MSSRTAHVGLIVRLAGRIARPTSRDELMSVVWTVVAAAVAAGSFATLLSIAGSLDQRIAVASGRELVRSPSGGALATSETYNSRTDELVLYRLGSRNGVERPPGVVRWPAAGQVVLSPALRAARESDAYLAALVPGQVVGTVDADGLRDPGELVAYLGVADKDLRRTGAAPITGFGRPDPAVSEVSRRTVRMMSGLGFLLVGVGGLALATTVARLVALQRERRLAVLILLGAGTPVVRSVVAVATAGAALVGSVAGTTLTNLALDLVRGGSVNGASGWVRHVAWPTSLLLAATVAAVLAALSARAVGTDAWELRQRAPDRRARPARALPLLAGTIALGGVLVAQQRHRGTAGYTPENVVLVLFGAIVVIAVGSVLAGPWLLQRIAALCGRGPLVLRIAASRVSHHAHSTSRITAVVCCLLVAGGAALGVLAATKQQFNEPGPVVTLELPAPGEAGAQVVRSLARALSSVDVVSVSAGGTDGELRTISAPVDARPDDLGYQVVVPTDRATEVAAQMIDGWVRPPPVYPGERSGERAVLLLGGLTVVGMALGGVQLVLAVGLAMSILQARGRRADQSLLLAGMGEGRLAAIRTAESVLAVLVAPLLIAGIAAGVSVGMMRVDRPSFEPEPAMILILLALPVGAAAVLGGTTWLSAPRAVQGASRRE